MDKMLQPAANSDVYHTHYGQVIKAGTADEDTVTLEEELLTGHGAIDDDHRLLVGLIEDFRLAVETKQGDATVGQVLCDLATYAAAHFEREETLMRRLRYPEAEQHRAEHDGFLSDLGELVDSFDSGCPGVARETLGFLTHWWVDHMAGWDRRLVDFLNAQKKAAKMPEFAS